MVLNGRIESLTQKVICLWCISGTKAFLLAAQFHWTGQVVRMEDNQLPKHIVFGHLSSGKYPQLKRCGLCPKSLSSAPLDRALRLTMCEAAISSFEEFWVAELEAANPHGLVM